MSAGSPTPADPAVTAGLASARAAGDEAGQTVTVGAPTDRQAAAFFDVDNTIMRGASIFHLARGLYRHKFFTLRDVLGFVWQQLHFTLIGENLGHVADIETKALSYIEGHSVAELRGLGEEVFNELIPTKIWPGTHALARMHLDAGQRVWLVTATPVEVAEVIASRLGLTGALGTIAEHVDGQYTGRLVGQVLHGPAKMEAVKALAEREGLDLARCSAYSDSANDIPLLTMVGHPCAINPDGKLRALARAQGWRVRDYRHGRTAARIGLPAVGAAVVAGGVVAAAVSLSRRRRG